MCLLVVQHNNPGTITKKSELIPKDKFDEIWDENPHGFGLGWFKDGKPFLAHTMFKAKAWDIYLENYNEFKGEMIVHWRWSTGGVKADENCHPFLTSTPNPSILGHNGIISPTPKCPDNWSDTRWFAASLSELLKHPEAFGHEEDESTIKQYLGASRLAIIEPDNKLHTWNFPTQSPDTSKYGLFSVHGFCRKRTVSVVYHHNWNTGGCYRSSTHSPGFSSRSMANTGILPYIDPKLVDRETFVLPHTFFLFEILEVDSYIRYDTVMERFFTRFGRFPTAQETMGAFALSTHNRKLKAAKKEEKPEEETVNHGI